MFLVIDISEGISFDDEKRYFCSIGAWDCVGFGKTPNEAIRDLIDDAEKHSINLMMSESYEEEQKIYS